MSSSSMGSGAGLTATSADLSSTASWASFAKVDLFFEPGLRPRLALGFSSVAGAAATSGWAVFSATGATVSVCSGNAGISLNKGVGAGRAGVLASSFCALSLVAVYTLSPSFFILMRERLRGCPSLRSSLFCCAATFFVAPTIACSSRIRYTSSSFFSESTFFRPNSLAICCNSDKFLSFNWMILYINRLNELLILGVWSMTNRSEVSFLFHTFELSMIFDCFLLNSDWIRRRFQIPFCIIASTKVSVFCYKHE